MPARMSSEDRRRQLETAAMAQLAAGGPASLTFDAVGARAGVTRNLLYHYFPGGTAELAVAAHERAGHELTDDWSTDPALPLPERLARNFGRMLEHAARPSDAWLVRRIGSGSVEPAVRRVHDAYAALVVSSIAENNLGTREPGELARTALEGYLAFAERLLDGVRDRDLPPERVFGLLQRVLAETISSLDES